jgi:hypothetical protein
LDFPISLSIRGEFEKPGEPVVEFQTGLIASLNVEVHRLVVGFVFLRV